MRVEQGTLTIETAGRELVDLTSKVAAWLARSGLARGTVTLFCRHTSASLLISENADPAVKAMLTGSGLTVPFAGGRLMLGTWQAIYLAEHRVRGHRREVILSAHGE